MGRWVTEGVYKSKKKAKKAQRKMDRELWSGALSPEIYDEFSTEVIRGQGGSFLLQFWGKDA